MYSELSSDNTIARSQGNSLASGLLLDVFLGTSWC